MNFGFLGLIKRWTKGKPEKQLMPEESARIAKYNSDKAICSAFFQELGRRQEEFHGLDTANILKICLLIHTFWRPAGNLSVDLIGLINPGVTMNGRQAYKLYRAVMSASDAARLGIEPGPDPMRIAAWINTCHSEVPDGYEHPVFVPIVKNGMIINHNERENRIVAQRQAESESEHGSPAAA